MTATSVVDDLEELTKEIELDEFEAAKVDPNLEFNREVDAAWKTINLLREIIDASSPVLQLTKADLENSQTLRQRILSLQKGDALLENKSAFEKAKDYSDDRKAEFDADAAFERSQLKVNVDRRKAVEEHNEKMLEEYASDPHEIGTTPEEARLLD